MIENGVDKLTQIISGIERVIYRVLLAKFIHLFICYLYLACAIVMNHLAQEKWFTSIYYRKFFY